MNAALHRIAVTRWQGVGELSRACVTSSMATGSTKTEAIRLLRRQLSDVVYRRLRLDEGMGQVTSSALAAWQRGNP